MQTEVGRVLLGNISIIEYDMGNEIKSFFVQCGVAGFYASEKELHDLYGALNYYTNIDSMEDIVVSIKEL